jgi:hypothetical protein
MQYNKLQFYIKKGDTLPSLQVRVVELGCLLDRQPANLNGVTGATFTLKDDCGNLKISENPAHLISVSGGVIQYNWRAGDTDTSGRFIGEFQLNYSNGARMSIPQTGNILVYIEDGILPY